MITKFTGKPFAAKELDKRKFIKNGVLDQKVENEMNIMQKIKHVRQEPLRQNLLMLCSHIGSQTLWNTSNTSTGTIGSSSSLWSLSREVT